MSRTVRLRRISGKSLIRQVWIVFDRSGWFDDVDPAGSCADGELGSPDGRFQGGGQVGEQRLFPFAIVGRVAWSDHVADLELRFGAVVVDWRIRTVDRRHCLIATATARGGGPA